MKTIHNELRKQLPDDNTESWDLVVGVPDDGQDYNFSRSGCDLITTLATDVVEVECALFKRNIFGRIVESQFFKCEVCGEVLDAYHNGTQYYQNERGDWINENEINFKKRA